MSGSKPRRQEFRMANLVNLQGYDKAFKESMDSLAIAKAHLGLVKKYLSERPLISQRNFNAATAEMEDCVEEIINSLAQFHFAVANFVHANRDGRG
jgi:hypothetical protein